MAMPPHIFWFASAIVADYPDAVQSGIQQAGNYIKKAAGGLLGWVAHNPNEFVIALSAFVTAIFTVVLAIATIRLWNSTADLAKFAEQQASDMQESIRLAREAAENARQELVLTQRPKLRVRNIVIEDQRVHKGRSPLFEEKKWVRGKLAVVNVGGTRAVIVGSLCIVYWSPEGLPLQSPCAGREGNAAFTPQFLAVGQAISGMFESEKVMDGRGHTIGTEIVGGLHLYVMGWVDYRDDIGVLRRTTFCREYQGRGFAHGRFGPVDDTDYEYED
jgi:hypothetical protein